LEGWCTAQQVGFMSDVYVEDFANLDIAAEEIQFDGVDLEDIDVGR
jgi:hypothetical protein